MFASGRHWRIIYKDQAMCACFTVLLADALGVTCAVGIIGPQRIHGDFELAEITARLGAHLLEFSKFARERFRRESQRCSSVTDCYSVAQRPIHIRTDSTGADMDRRMGLAGGLGIALHWREFDELAVETGLWPGPQFLHRADILARDRPSPLEIDTHDLAFVTQPSGADAKNKASARVMIESGDFFGENNRITFWNQANPGAQADRLVAAAAKARPTNGSTIWE